MTSTVPLPSRVADDPAVVKALRTIRNNLATLQGRFPADTTTHGRYRLRPAVEGFPEGANRGWTTGFWAGQLWIGWELVGDTDLRDAGLALATDFARRLRAAEDVDTHDLGFLYTLSCVAPARLLEDQSAREAGLLAADLLMRRFLEPAGILQAWGDLADPHQRGRTIIDSLMNLPLLTWASEQTGDERYAAAAARHAEQLRGHILREDDSTFHTFYWDPVTGEPLRGATEQGAHDDSCWARGQAWGIYGFALNHRSLGDPRLLEASRRCARYFLAHLPEDHVPCWDLAYAEDGAALRDSSAAAIAACGLFELAGQEEDPEAAARWTSAAESILDSLAAAYAPDSADASDALLLHGVYDLPKSVGVDEGTLWGDYFYLEALTRRAAPGWRAYW